MKNRILSVTFLTLLISLMMSSCTKKDEPIVYKDPGLVWTNPADITEGTPLSYAWQLNATADAEGTYIYTPPVGVQLGIGNNQELKVDFYPDGYYKRASKTVKINVLPSLKPTNGLTTAVFNTTKTYGTMTDPASIATYGRLYNWYTVTNSHNIAPMGWHVPSDVEWTTLINYLGGENVAGGKMKETGTAHWTAPNTGATNESGFTSLPSGSRGSNIPEPSFSFMGACSYYWTSTEPGPNYAVGNFCRLSSDNASVYRYDNYKMQGFAVRLVKD